MTKYEDLDLVDHLLSNDLDVAGRDDIVVSRNNELVIVYQYTSSFTTKQSNRMEWNMIEQWRATIPEVKEEIQKQEAADG